MRTKRLKPEIRNPNLETADTKHVRLLEKLAITDRVTSLELDEVGVSSRRRLRRMAGLRRCGAALSVACLAARVAIAASGGTATGAFGFSGPEVFPIDPFIGQLHAADLDGDGLQDLVVVNNSRSKITLLFNQTGKTNAAAPTPVARPRSSRELNELPPDARFRIDSVASEKRIAALVVEDLNGDRRPDLAYFGEPKELVVQYHQGANEWSAPKRWPLDDGQTSPNALTTGDLNGDGLTDLVLLGESAIHWLAQKSDHTLAEPEKIAYSGAVKSVQVLDIDGNGRDDLLLVNWENQNPFRFRLQNIRGQLGPEIHFSLAPVRSYWADDLDGDHKTEIMTIAMQSGRAQVSHFSRKNAEPLAGAFRAGQFQVLPLQKTTKSKRGTAWGDVNGDGRADLLVAEPDSGQLTVLLQQADGSLSAGQSFPTLTGVSEIVIGPAAEGGGAEIYLFSPDERQVGVTRFDPQGRVAFPTALPMDGKPLAIARAPLKAGARPTLAVILDQDGKRVLLTRGPDGTTATQKLNENFKSNPSAMMFHDVNHDGLADLVILIPYEKMKILLHVTGKEFDEQDVAPPGGTLEQPWATAADVDGDGRAELLLAQKNFLRAVVLQKDASAKEDDKPTWSFKVKDQINGAGSNSRIVGAAPLRNGERGIASLFLLDGERKALSLCERDSNSVWQVVKNLPLPVTEFTELQPLALGGELPNSVAFLGLNMVAWMPTSGDVWELQELDGYETPIKDGRLNDVVSGDLNQDGKKDLVFLETAKNHLDLVIFEPPGKLVPANRWQVFEERTFRSRRSDAPEPREALIVDLTGDGKNDLAVIVHDRVLVYPQE